MPGLSGPRAPRLFGQSGAEIADDYAQWSSEVSLINGLVRSADLVARVTGEDGIRLEWIRLRGRDLVIVLPGGIELTFPLTSGRLALEGGGGSGGMVLLPLDTSAFNNSLTTFDDLIPSEPDLSMEVMIFRKGAMPLFYTSGVPTSAEFSLSDGTGPNRTVTFGLAPPAGKANVLYLPA